MKIIKKENGLFDIEVDGIIIGGGSMVEAESDDDFNYLERLDIDEAHRNQGHGTAALYELAKVYGSYYLAPDNEDAQRLYERVADEIKQGDYDSFGFAIDQGFGVYEI
jgi:ribosomal protein S18 acetylase RimI-like enzyme